MSGSAAFQGPGVLEWEVQQPFSGVRRLSARINPAATSLQSCRIVPVLDDIIERYPTIMDKDCAYILYTDVHCE